MATTYQLTTIGTRVMGHKGPAAYAVGKIIRIANIASGVGVVASDVVQAIYVPALTVCLGVYVQVRSGQSPDELCSAALSSENVGDGADTNGYHAAKDFSAAVSAWSGNDSMVLVNATPNTISGYSNGKFYSAADTIDVLFSATGTVGVVKVMAVLLPLQDRLHSDSSVDQA